MSSGLEECFTRFYTGFQFDRGAPMSHVDFKKWQCRMSLSFTYPMSHVESKERVCPMSLYFSHHVTCH